MCVLHHVHAGRKHNLTAVRELSVPALLAKLKAPWSVCRKESEVAINHLIPRQGRLMTPTALRHDCCFSNFQYHVDAAVRWACNLTSITPALPSASQLLTAKTLPGSWLNIQ